KIQRTLNVNLTDNSPGISAPLPPAAAPTAAAPAAATSADATASGTAAAITRTGIRRWPVAGCRPVSRGRPVRLSRQRPIRGSSARTIVVDRLGEILRLDRALALAARDAALRLVGRR